MTKIDFEFETEYGIFRDAIMLPEDHQYTEQEIKVMQENRLNNWLLTIKTFSNAESPAIDGEVVDNG